MRLGIVAEPSAAAPLAALLTGGMCLPSASASAWSSAVATPPRSTSARG